MRILVITGALALTCSAPALAQQTILDAKTAQAIISGCVARALAKGDQQAIVVVDTGGRTIAALRMDRASFGKMDFALTKAVAAAAWGFGTAGQSDGAKEFPGFALAPHVVTVPGGVPVLSADGRSRIGAVGVSGAAPADDVACAEAGIVAAGLRPSRG
jgi:glc operon protein GlcG